MAGFHVHLRNSLGQLYELLFEILKTPLISPLAPEIILTQNPLLKDYVASNLAQKLNCWANFRFLEPQDYFLQFVEQTLERQKYKGFLEGSLAWVLMRLLPNVEEQSAFESVKLYLQNDVSGLKRLQFCQQIAQNFYQYQLYEAEFLKEWEAGLVHHWQAQLWRMVSKAYGEESLINSRQLLTEVIPHHLPERLTLIGVNFLPPLYLNFLEWLAQYTDIYCLLFTSKEHTHPIWQNCYEVELALLEQLKARNFNIQTRWKEQLNQPLDFLQEAKAVSSNQSLHIHSAFSPMREVEDLYNQILNTLAENPALKLSDIGIFTPDLPTYGSLIEAVFSASEPALPFSVAGQTQYFENSLSELLFALLKFRSSRWEASEVIGLLESPCIYRRFGFQEEDLKILTRWIQENYIRWGRDENHTKELGFKDFYTHTWKFGLDRMYLGLALPLEEEVYQGIHPYQHIEGNLAVLLGKLTSFLRALERFYEQTHEAHKVSYWLFVLQSLLEQFFRPSDEQTSHLQAIREILVELDEEVKIARFEETVPFEMVVSEVERRLKHNLTFSRAFDGRLIVAPLEWSNYLPFKVSFLLGLNGTTFPRKDGLNRFDYLQQLPEFHAPERHQSKLDRHYFRQAALAPEKALNLSFIGQSHLEQQTIPPSLVLDEMMNHTKHSVMQYPLKPYDIRYFQADSPLKSYSTLHYETAQALIQQTKVTPKAFIEKPLPHPPEELKTLTLDQLINFFKSPCKVFIQQRLGLYARDDQELLDDQETLKLDSLERYQLTQTLVDQALRGEDLEKLYPVFQAQGLLPHGAIGQITYRQLAFTAQQFAEDYRENLRGEKLEPLPVKVQLGDFTLTGQLDSVYTDGLRNFRVAHIKGKDRIQNWILHLIWNLIQTPQPKETLFWANEWHILFSEVEEPQIYLEQLLQIYWQGLTFPLPLFSGASYDFVKTLTKTRSSEEAYQQAVKTFYKELAYNPFEALCYDDEVIFGSGFLRLAQQVYLPLLEHQQEIKH